jgi:hypothetical protein
LSQVHFPGGEGKSERKKVKPSFAYRINPTEKIFTRAVKSVMMMSTVKPMRIRKKPV